MEKILNIETPNYKASFLKKWNLNNDFSNCENVIQVYGIIFNEENKVLLVKIKGDWRIPGGHIEDNETYEQALEREIFEETNVKIKFLKKIGFLEVRQIKNNFLSETFYQLIYNGTIKELCERKNDPSNGEIGEIKFVNIEDFPKYIPWEEVGEKIVKDCLNRLKKDTYTNKSI